MTDLTERLVHFEQNQVRGGDKYGAEVLYRARRRIDELEAERDELRRAARAVLDAYADGADLNELYDVIGSELAPLLESPLLKYEEAE